MDVNYNELMNEAKEASKNSYSPFSRFAVGAAVLASSGKIYRGCNIENSSFGLTNCAERCAIFKAVSEGEREIRAVAIYSPNADSCYPCGACRQVMYEFQGDDEELEVITENLGQLDINKLSYFLPCGFRI
ncbi:MAG: cytidine deaminase [Candidatus Gastranaerophilales bacterium]|nr:cytidine deaminase [Candidatus Gastranaerophilales bacterium]MCM1073493.1 cytidine deaminase [Bacteroides sp.]